MKHLIVNATPKRKSLLVYENPNSNTPLSKRLKGNRVGRLEKVTEKIKKQLFFSEDCNKLWSKKKLCNSKRNVLRSKGWDFQKTVERQCGLFPKQTLKGYAL